MAIDRVEGISTKEFARDYIRARRPVVLAGAANPWPAMEKWSFEYFKGIGEDTTVGVEVGNANQYRTFREKWNLSKYINYIVSGRFDGLDGRGDRPGGIPYLVVFDLFKHFPHLVEDVDFSMWPNGHRFYAGWIGPQGAYTGLHYDKCHGLLAQIRGSKRLRVYDPGQWPYMYESSKWDFGSVLSRVDARHPDLEKFPLFAKAEYQEVVIEAGDILYIPRRWPHDVLTLSPSISLSCFGETLAGLVFIESLEEARSYLHHAGLYKKNNCACHPSNSDGG
jgi:hypothetical protein